MRWRLASIAFLLGVVTTGVSWLTLLPLLTRLLERSSRQGATGPVGSTLPLLLGADLLVASLLCLGVLAFTVGRPLQRVEEAIGALGRLDAELPLPRAGGPLVARLQATLGRLGAALQREQALTQQQLTELRQTNARLAQAQTELAARERLALVGRLAAGVAHEVGNPLAGILGYLSLARASASGNPDVLDFLGRIDVEVQRIDHIVRGLLDLGRPPTLQNLPLDLGTVVRSCVQLIRAAPELAQVTVEVDVAPGELARGDAGALSQVLINLLLNAAQAGAPHVWVRAGREEAQVILHVEDAGPGIAPDVLPRIFEPFFTTRAAGKGTGLGLAISRHLVEVQGGQLTVGPREGGGARFSIHLPPA